MLLIPLTLFYLGLVITSEINSETESQCIQQEASAEMSEPSPETNEEVTDGP